MTSTSSAFMMAVTFMLLTATKTSLATNSDQQQQQNQEQQPLDIMSVRGELLSSVNIANDDDNDDNNNNDLFVQHAAAPGDDVYIASLVNSQGNLNINPNMDDYNIQNNALDSEQNVEETTFPPPVFDFGMPRNITARTGQTAAINCRVENLGDKSVSWIRKRDLHILTAGILTYTSDERFKVVRTADSKDWTLHVKYAQPRDTGIYECQVNTEPKISMAFRLNVIVTPPDAKAIIAGPADLYVKVGSVITLTCHVKQPSATAQDIGPIYWYRGQYVLTPFVAHPNDAAIDLQRISMESTLAEKLQSRLRIANAQLVDSGNYTCMPTTAEAASVLVNVINDESPAAMQKSGAKSWCVVANMLSTTMVSVLSINTVVRWLCQLQKQQQRQQLRLFYLLCDALCAFCALFVHIKYPIRLLFGKLCTATWLTPTTTTATTTRTISAPTERRKLLVSS